MTDRKVSSLEIEGQTRELIASDDANLEIYIDGVQGIMRGSGMVKMNLFSVGFHSNGDDIERRELVARLVMSDGAFQSIAELMLQNTKEAAGLPPLAKKE